MIATLAEFKLYLWIVSDDTSKDTLLTLFLDWANQLVETYISRTIKAQDYEEIIDGNGQYFLLLENTPVNSVSKISMNIGTAESQVWQEISKEDYSTKFNVGKVSFFRPLARGFKNYKIEYNAWYTTIPSDLKLAVLKLASKYYKTKDSDWITSESVAGDSISYDASQIPSDILSILSIYRDL